MFLSELTRSLSIIILAINLTGCAENRPETNPVEPAHSGSSYAFVWAADPDSTDSDFLAVLDVNEGSSTFGKVLATVPVGVSGMAHHTEHRMPEGNRLLANSFAAGQTFVLNLSDPLNPFVERSFEGVGEYTYPHSFERTSSGNILATFQTKGEGNQVTGGLVELDPVGNLVRSSDAANPDAPEIRAYSLGLVPDIDRVVTTTSDMNMVQVSKWIQVWRLSDLELLQTVELPPGPRGDEHLDPAEARVLEDGRTVIVTTFRCGMYLLEGLDGTDDDMVTARFVASFPFESAETGECGLPARLGKYWIQTVGYSGDLVALDLSDPTTPIKVDTLNMGEGANPHWLSLEPSGNRILLTGYDSMEGMVYIVRLDPDSGTLTLDERFRAAGASGPGVSFLRDQWLHGSTGNAHPHGAVFSRD